MATASVAPRGDERTAGLPPGRLVGITAAGLPLIAAVVMVPASGGYAIEWWGIASLVILTTLATMAAAGVAHDPGVLGWVGIGGFLMLGAWQGLSSSWAYEPGAAVQAMNLTFLYAACITLVLVALPRRSDARILLIATAVAIGGVDAVLALSRWAPGLVPGDHLARLSTGISYWNAVGLMMALGGLLAIGLASHAGLPMWARGVAAAWLPLCLSGLLFTLSRGAVLCLIVGLIALVVLCPGRLETCAVALAGIAASLPLLVWANGQDGLVAISGAAPGGAGVAGLGALIASMVVVGLVTAGITAAIGRWNPSQRDRLRAGGVAGGLSALVVAAILIAARPAGGWTDWAQARFDAFRSFSPGARNTAASLADRLGEAAGSGRWQNWTVAWQQGTNAPIIGTGAGDYRYAWEANRPLDLKVVNAHSLYLETFGDSGLIGVVLLFAVAAAIAIATWRVLAHRGLGAGGLARDTAIASSAVVLLAVNVAGDWAWQLPSTILPVLVLAALVLVAVRPEPARQLQTSAVAATAAFGVVAALLVIGPVVSARALGEGRDLARQGDFAQALSAAEAAQNANPLSYEAALLAADVATDTRRWSRANRAYARAAALSPQSADVLFAWSNSLQAQGRTAESRVVFRDAVARNPRDPRARAGQRGG